MPGEEASEEKGIYFQFACNRWFNMMQDMLILKKKQYLLAQRFIIWTKNYKNESREYLINNWL